MAATPQQGALIQVRVDGDAEAPTLRLGWHAITNKGSATPSISKGDEWVVIGDGAIPPRILIPPVQMDS